MKKTLRRPKYAHELYALLFFVSILCASENQTPKTAQDYCTLAEVCETQKKPYEAIEQYEKALQVKPNDPTILFHLGRISYYADNREKSIFYLKKLEKLCPHSFVVHETLAVVYRSAGMLDEEKTSLENALKLESNHPSLQVKLMEYYLRRQDSHTVAARWPQPRFPWYDDQLSGKKCFLQLGQAGWGLGDAIQMIRYAKILKESGASVIVQVEPALIPLFSLCPYIDTLIPDGKPVPSHDETYGCNLYFMALKAIGISGMTIFAQPYLYANATLEKYWRNKVAANTEFKVGIFWESNRFTNYYETKTRSSERSIPLEKLALLTKIPGVTCYSLQKKHGLSEYQNIPLKNKIIDFSAEMDTEHGRFMDTAALMKNLDLVITVDTSIAHLAGALGIPVWVMLCHAADWRWFTEREDSPWYRTMRLFRQPKSGDWDSVIENVKHELQKIMIPQACP